MTVVLRDVIGHLARVGCVLSAVVVGLGADRPLRPVPRVDGSKIPDPPRQEAPWTPPGTKLPRFLVTATAMLGEQGLADPRGCDYRAVELAGEGGLYHDPASPRPATHAWVLPAIGAADGPRFAVAWNGLVYPLTALGEAADLEGDVRALIEAAAKARAEREQQPAPFRRNSGWSGSYSGAIGNLPTASQQALTPTKVGLLLRLGRADLAEALWEAGTGRRPEGGRRDLTPYGISYLTLASDWAWARFDRAVAAHARGDDPLALADARELTRIRPLIEGRAEAMGFPHRNAFPGGALDYLDFLDPLPALLADQERRAREPGRVPDPAQIADRDARIAALIREFDRIAEQSYSIPGRANPAGSAVVKEVIDQGEAAVEPLLRCLARDDRLTRTVDRDQRHGTRYVHVAGVNEAAFGALVAILGTREFGPAARTFPGSASDRGKIPAVVAEVRAYWEKNRGVGPEERRYRTLADDSATPAQWLDAAEALAQPSDVRGRGGSYLIPYRMGGKVPPPRGEPLRGRKDPSIADLMARRVASIDPGRAVAGPRSGSGDVFRARDATRMALFLADWDLKAALPTLKARVARTAAIVRASEGDTSRHDGLEADLAGMTLLRVRGGDPEALEDYAAWVRTVTPSGFGSFPVEMFEPMWRNPDHPSIAAAAVALFDDPKSPWVPLFRPRQRGWSELGGLSDAISSPLLGLAPFRKLVLSGLADLSEAGTIVTDASGQVEIHVGDGWTTWPEPSRDDPLRPRPSMRMPLRLADLYCWKLQGIGGMPRLEMYWPEAERDRAIAACVATLEQYGERFHYSEAARPLYESASFYPLHARAILAFDPLDRPATPDDVRAGRALFALEGAEVRRWPLPSCPIKARWTTLEIAADDPGLRPFDMSKGKPLAQIEMLQGGTVWQAEEVREGGRWRRYFGFVGRHVLARVSAEDIEFPAPWNTGWVRLSNALDGRLVPPGGLDDGSRIVGREAGLGGPLPVAVQLRNRRGIEATMPATAVRTAGGLSLREGLAVRLFRDPDATTPPRLPTLAQAPAPPWEEIPSRHVRRHRDGGTDGTLAPAEVAQAFQFDLRDLFAVDRPGRYRLEIAFEDMTTPAGKPGVLAEVFTAVRAPKSDR